MTTESDIKDLRDRMWNVEKLIVALNNRIEEIEKEIKEINYEHNSKEYIYYKRHI